MVRRLPEKDIFEVYGDVTTVLDHKRRWSRVQGRETKMGFTQFMYKLFQLNEDAARGRKTDATLLEIVLKEFDHSPKTMSSFDAGNQSISKLRHEFNAGRLQPKSWPPEAPGKVKQISLRYNALGQPVNSGSPTKLADNGYLKKQIHRFSDTVVETWQELFTRLGRKKTNWVHSDATE